MNAETKEILLEAKAEIIQLRRQNEILRAKVDTMELMAGAIYATVPRREAGMGVDVAWQIEKFIAAQPTLENTPPIDAEGRPLL